MLSLSRVRIKARLYSGFGALLAIGLLAAMHDGHNVNHRLLQPD